MLDSNTKNKIDTARDLLVGKVPDPKSQVEQITIALIYKFMDDMDAEAEELGGVRKFFSGDYEKYSWAKLMQASIGGHEKLSLYAEAITKMTENDKLPALFRDIFKNAYLPYRDPETLNQFLKEINGFKYDHSERLGDAFEYLLSVLGSQGDAGQFRTPRHIIDFIVEVIEPQKNESILDPACGTAGFLISAYKHILKANSKNGQTGAALSPDERTWLTTHIKGYDISPDMVRLSLVNLYLHEFAAPDISEYDTLTSQDNWNQYSDIILANPPFMSPKGGIKPHKRFSITSKRSEVLFIDYIAEHLNPNGRAAVIVPEGIIFQSQKAYKELREMLVKNYLYAVVSLPAGIFQPYSGVKTSILLMDKALAKKTSSLLFVKIDNDGFNLGAQRREIEHNDLPEALQCLREFSHACRSGETFAAEKYPKVLQVEKDKIGENGEWNLSGERYRVNNIHISKYKLISIHQICKKVKDNISPSKFSGSVNYIGLENIKPNYVGLVGRIKYEYSEIKSIKTKIQINDILYGKLRPNLNKVYLSEIKGICSTDILVYRVNDDCIASYLSYVMRSTIFNKKVLQGISGAQLPRVNTSYFETIKIPLPPLNIQQEIVAEIEGYQKIIDGARAVVDNYKPHIQIDPAWEMVELGDIITILTDYHANGSYKILKENVTLLDEKSYAWMIRSTDFENSFNNKLKYIDKHSYEFLSKSKVYSGDLIINKIGNAGKVYIVPELSMPCSLAMNQFLIRVDKEIFLNKFIYLCLKHPISKQQINSRVKGATTKTIDKQAIRSLTIHAPPLETQTQIVAQIEKEQALVNANKELIDLFEQKIKDKIASVWGEESA